jgi:DMSO/TMAO reductase YedYZ molybdopterin-dependent catalytic subunit
MSFNIFRKTGDRERALGDRLPPGQHATEKWPVLHAGSVPAFDRATWDFKVWGLVEQPLRFDYDQFLTLPHDEFRADIHCVTRWSLFGSVWRGISVQQVLRQARPLPEARFVMVHAEGGFSANLPLDDLDRPLSLFAYQRNGENISLEHGWPMRLVLPHLYFWKSAKWIRGLELMAEDRPGFWEQFGYHMRGDPWKEERYDWQ